MFTPKFVPTMGVIRGLGLTHQIDAVGSNSGIKYKGFINAEDERKASVMLVIWEDKQIQVAHKKAGDSRLDWKFKGFGTLEDEAHLNRLMQPNN